MPKFIEYCRIVALLPVIPLGINPIPTGLGHVTLVYGLILPMAGRNRVKGITGSSATILQYSMNLGKGPKDP